MLPPKLALLGCFLLAAWAYRWDRKKHPYPLATLWLPTLWMMRCGSRSIDAWFGSSEFGRLDPVFVGVMIVAGFAVLARRPCRWQYVFAHNSALFLFCGYLILSVTWATSLEDPAIKIFRPLGDLIMALVIVTEPNPRLAIVTMFRRTAILLIPLSIVLIRYFHELGTGRDKHWGTDAWIGVTTHKNPLGQLCLVSALAFLWSLAESRKKGERLMEHSVVWLYLAMTGYLFFGGLSNSRSSTSIFCFGVAVALFIVIGRMRDRINTIIRSIVLGTVVLVAVALLLDMSGTSLQAVVAGLYGKDPTLTDRTYLWGDVVRLGMDHPILGSGYGGFWVPSIYGKLSPMVDNRPGEAHNGYLETFANLGLVGVALLAWMILQSLSSAAKVIQTDFEYGRLRLVLIFSVLVMNYAEATFTVGTHLWWFGFLIVAIYAQPWVNWPQAQRAGTKDDRAEVPPHQEAVPV